jgi:hypothetical protein
VKGRIKVSHNIQTVPRPIVRTNQWFIFSSVIVTWITGQVWILLLPLLAGLAGLLFNMNPIMIVARLFLKKHPSSYTQEDSDQQKFNQLIASILIITGVIAGYTNVEILFYIATGMVAAASFIAILGFCIGCFIRYQWNQYQYRRKKKDAL